MFAICLVHSMSKTSLSMCAITAAVLACNIRKLQEIQLQRHNSAMLSGLRKLEAKRATAKKKAGVRVGVGQRVAPGVAVGFFVRAA